MNRSPAVGLTVLIWLAAASALAQTPAAPVAAPTPPPAPAPAPATAPVTPPAPAPVPADSAPPAPPTATVAAPEPVKAASLRAPDLFAATPGPTGLPDTLWRGASADLARAVIPLVAQRPLTPALAGFAARLMATGGQAPDGAGADADLAAARIAAVLSLGDAPGARAMLDHTPGVTASPSLSQVLAEADLVMGQADQACQAGDALTQGKDQPYFRRLRAFCLVRAGDTDAAQLAFDLADAQSKDAVYKRLMSAAVSGTAPGAASLRNGLDLALSQQLKLDLAPAVDTAWNPILAQMAATATYPDDVRAAAVAKLKSRSADEPPTVAAPVMIPLEAGDLKSARAARGQIERDDASGATVLELALIDAVLTTAEGRVDETVMDQLVERGTAGEAPDRARAQQAAALYAALGVAMSGQARAEFAGFDLGRSTASQARLLELEFAANRGDAALLSLWLAADAGPAGPPVLERAQIVRALRAFGFVQDARKVALEGLIGLITPPPEPVHARARPRRREP